MALVLQQTPQISPNIGAMQKALVWLRRDLRLYDNAALSHALKESKQVWLAFIFDTDILTPLIKGEKNGKEKEEKDTLTG